jgi:RNA polymerase sigma-70 factor (ECF subfamily)
MAERDPVPPRVLRVVPTGRYADWEAIYEDNATWVYRTMFARVGNRADAEDLTAEVFLAALRPLRVSASMAEVRGVSAGHRADGPGSALACNAGP